MEERISTKEATPAKADKVKNASNKAKKQIDVISVKRLVGYKEKGSYLFDFIQNLGGGGVFVQTDALKEPGQVVQISFSLPNSKTKVAVKGRVIWVQHPVENRQSLNSGIGVQLESLSNDDWQALANQVPKKTW